MAYAAVQSLMMILEMGADPNWILHNRQQVESLQENVSFLRYFLEEFSMSTSETVKDLEIKIRDVAYEAEDLIELYVWDQLSYKTCAENRHQTFCLDMARVIRKVRSVKEEAMEIRRRLLDLEYVQRGNCFPVDRSGVMFSGENTMVGFDEELIKIKDWLTSSSPKLEVMWIVGMGGLGKTTLARNVLTDSLIVYHFHVRAWVTVSQEYRVHDILAELLDSTSNPSPDMRKLSSEELAERLYKSLKGKTYLIIIDDLWETKGWDDVKRLFPDDNNGSRIILTTRLTNVGVHAASHSHVLNPSFLSSSESWNLLCKKVFGEECCPDYLVGIGQEIARYCQGLPLSLVVVGGLLSMNKTIGYWETIAATMNSLLAKEGGQCSKILSLSYNHFPAHLKPCFLYFAVFPEDYVIRRSKLIKLWVAEGFIEPSNSRNLKDVAEEYLEDLVNRNLVMILDMGYRGKVKTYRIHDLVREFCTKEVQKEKFLHVINQYALTHPEGIGSERRISISIYPNIPLKDYIYESNGAVSLTRSLLCYNSYAYISISNLDSFSLLRILDLDRIKWHQFPIEVVTLKHLRYLSSLS